jgi:membrane protease YdiL (CAAX protease family)
MSTAIDMRASRHSLLPVVAGVLLLLGRLVMLGRATSLPLLAITYAAVLAISRTVPTGSTGRAAFPLLAGLGAVAGVRILIASPFPIRSTAAGAALSLLAAVAEERLFRGAVFAHLRRYGVAVAVVGSAALFALVHLPFYGFAALPVDFGAGLLFAWQRSESGHWSVPAVTHAFANLVAVLP